MPPILLDKICLGKVGQEVHEESGKWASSDGCIKQGPSFGVYASARCQICFSNSSGKILRIVKCPWKLIVSAWEIFFFFFIYNFSLFSLNCSLQEGLMLRQWMHLRSCETSSMSETRPPEEIKNEKQNGLCGHYMKRDWLTSSVSPKMKESYVCYFWDMISLCSSLIFVLVLSNNWDWLSSSPLACNLKKKKKAWK